MLENKISIRQKTYQIIYNYTAAKSNYDGVTEALLKLQDTLTKYFTTNKTRK